MPGSTTSLNPPQAPRQGFMPCLSRSGALVILIIFGTLHLAVFAVHVYDKVRNP